MAVRPPASRLDPDVDLGPELQIGNMFSVRGKNVLVTGGARGIGLMIASGFAVNGARVAISSRDVQVGCIRLSLRSTAQPSTLCQPAGFLTYSVFSCFSKVTIEFIPTRRPTPRPWPS
jgi:hypothetical protein